MSTKPQDDAVNALQGKANRRLGLILGSVAVAFFVGFMVKIALLSGQFA